MDSNEKNKLLELKREHELNSTKLDWMYGNPNDVNDEEYLLGRSVQDNKNHVEYECIPPSIRDLKKQLADEDQVDLAKKLQEDPLVEIHRRQIEARKQMLQNPIKMKQIKEMLNNKQQPNDDDDDNKLNKKLIKKLKKLKKYKKKKSKKYKSESSSDSDHKKHRMRRRRSQEREQQYVKYRNRSNSRERDGKRKLSDDEKQRKMNEMLANAKWKEQTRNKSRLMNRCDDDVDMKNNYKQDPAFLKKYLLNSTDMSTVESRIKSNINHIQRRQTDMNSSFVRR